MSLSPTLFESSISEILTCVGTAQKFSICITPYNYYNYIFPILQLCIGKRRDSAVYELLKVPELAKVGV